MVSLHLVPARCPCLNYDFGFYCKLVLQVSCSILPRRFWLNTKWKLASLVVLPLLACLFLLRGFELGSQFLECSSYIFNSTILRWIHFKEIFNVRYSSYRPLLPIWPIRIHKLKHRVNLHGKYFSQIGCMIIA